MEKVEYVARAIFVADGCNPDMESEPGYKTWHDYVNLARAAIKACKENDAFHEEFILVKEIYHKRDCALIISKNYGCDCKKIEEN